MTVLMNNFNWNGCIYYEILIFRIVYTEIGKASKLYDGSRRSVSIHMMVADVALPSEDVALPSEDVALPSEIGVNLAIF